MKMLPFDLHAVEYNSWPVVTRDGHYARIVQTDAEHDYMGRNQPIKARIYVLPDAADADYILEGFFFTNGAYWEKEDHNDLFLLNEFGHLWEIGAEVRFKPGLLEELDSRFDRAIDGFKNSTAEEYFYAPRIFDDRLKVGVISTLNEPWNEFDVIAYCVNFGLNSWIIPQSWLQLASLTKPIRDIPGYTDTYVSGDEFLKIIRACSGDHL